MDVWIGGGKIDVNNEKDNRVYTRNQQKSYTTVSEAYNGQIAGSENLEILAGFQNLKKLKNMILSYDYLWAMGV